MIRINQPLSADGRSTVVEFLIDETGSMGSYLSSTISAFNAFLTEQSSLDGHCLFSLSKFSGGEVRTPVQDIDVRYVPLLSSTTYRPFGGTNLLDAIDRRISSLRERLNSWNGDHQVLFVVLTDGEDNMSRCSPDTISAQIKSLEATNWRFMYLGATSKALSIANQLGFDQSRSKKFEMKEIEKTMATLSAATTVYRATGHAAI